jgi:hypothetical protein
MFMPVLLSFILNLWSDISAFEITTFHHPTCFELGKKICWWDGNENPIQSNYIPTYPPPSPSSTTTQRGQTKVWSPGYCAMSTQGGEVYEGMHQNSNDEASNPEKPPPATRLVCKRRQLVHAYTLGSRGGIRLRLSHGYGRYISLKNNSFKWIVGELGDRVGLATTPTPHPRDMVNQGLFYT